MTDPQRAAPVGQPGAPPHVAPPRPFVERRRASRRAADRLADEERHLLAVALDVLASDHPAEGRLAGLLDLLADTVGAERAALVAGGEPRRAAVASSGPDDDVAAMGLATWLDTSAPRSRARRVAAAPAHVLVATRTTRRPADRRRTVAGGPFYAWLPIPAAGDVTLGFSFARPTDATTVGDRLPPALARHAAVALALVTESMSTERELVALRAGKGERDRFVSTIAHELRTPLTGLSGYLDLILDGQVDDEAVEREFLERGRSIVASMDALVGDLLELSKLESGSLGLESAPFSVADALHAVSSGLLPIALQRGVRLLNTPPPRIRTATGDRRRVEQIVTNLAGNALKFASDGGEVEMAGWTDGPIAVIAVRDEGPGIGAEDRGRIFERFYRMADHERVTGTGLGLSISRDLARTMGGELDVASMLGVGSAFVLVLPGPGAPVEPEVIENATAAALEYETDRLEAVAAIRSAKGRRSSARPAPLVVRPGATGPSPSVG